MSQMMAYIGCRTTRERNAKGEGLAVFAMDDLHEPWTLLDLMPGLDNPSWLCPGPDGKTIYVTHGDRNDVSAFRRDDREGRLALVGTFPCGGRNPVHLSLDRTGRFLVVTNHVVTPECPSGLTCLPIYDDGSLGPVIDRLPFDGPIGPHRIEQPFPKPHQSVLTPGGRFLAVPDKGTDRVMVHRMDEQGRFQADPASVMIGREGAGPRHIAFHPSGRFAYVVNELNSTVIACSFDPETGALKALQVVASLRATCVAFSRAAAILVSTDGGHVYASNRGDDTVGVFAVDQQSGFLTPMGWRETGATPRFITLSPDGQGLLIANEDDHSIMACRLDPVSGMLGAPVVVARTGSPTSILFSKAACAETIETRSSPVEA